MRPGRPAPLAPHPGGAPRLPVSSVPDQQSVPLAARVGGLAVGTTATWASRVCAFAPSWPRCPTGSPIARLQRPVAPTGPTGAPRSAAPAPRRFTPGRSPGPAPGPSDKRLRGDRRAGSLQGGSQEPWTPPSTRVAWLLRRRQNAPTHPIPAQTAGLADDVGPCEPFHLRCVLKVPLPRRWVQDG